MKRSIVVLAFALTCAGCQSVDRLINGGPDSPAATSSARAVAFVGALQSSHVVTISPALGAGELLQGVSVRAGGQWARIDSVVIWGTYYTYDATAGMITVHGYTAGDYDAGGNNFSVSIASPLSPSFHSVR